MTDYKLNAEFVNTNIIESKDLINADEASNIRQERVVTDYEVLANLSFSAMENYFDYSLHSPDVTEFIENLVSIFNFSYSGNQVDIDNYNLYFNTLNDLCDNYTETTPTNLETLWGFLIWFVHGALPWNNVRFKGPFKVCVIVRGEQSIIECFGEEEYETLLLIYPESITLSEKNLITDEVNSQTEDQVILKYTGNNVSYKTQARDEFTFSDERGSVVPVILIMILLVIAIMIGFSSSASSIASSFRSNPQTSSNEERGYRYQPT